MVLSFLTLKCIEKKLRKTRCTETAALELVRHESRSLIQEKRRSGNHGEKFSKFLFVSITVICQLVLQLHDVSVLSLCLSE